MKFENNVHILKISLERVTGRKSKFMRSDYSFPNLAFVKGTIQRL